MKKKQLKTYVSPKITILFIGEDSILAASPGVLEKDGDTHVTVEPSTEDNEDTELLPEKPSSTGFQ